MKDQAMRKEKSWLYAIFVDCSFRCLLQVLFAAASSKAHIKVEITVMERGSGNEAMDKILWSILNIIEYYCPDVLTFDVCSWQNRHGGRSEWVIC